ncbi:unnamed protein product [Cunninghamella blakesleeana]
MANFFANMDEPPTWISASSHNTGNIFYPDDGYSSPRTSVDMTQSPEAELEHQRFIMAMAQEQRQNDSEYLTSKLWWLGITLMVLGEVGNFVAYGFAPASTIAPIGCTTLVANVILAPLMLKEAFRKRDLIGIILAVTGATIVVLSSNDQETALSPELIMESLAKMRSIIYFIVTGVAIGVLTAISPWYGSESIMVDLGLVAIYGGYTVLCTKSVASLLSLTLFKMFTYPISYILILVLVATAVLQIKYLNKALQRFDSTAVIPTQFVLFTVAAIVGSAVIYGDFDDAGLNQMSRFMSGCVIEFLGVYFITSKREKRLGSLSLKSDKDEPRQPVNISAEFPSSTPRTSLDGPVSQFDNYHHHHHHHHQQQQQNINNVSSTGLELNGAIGSGRMNPIIQQSRLQSIPQNTSISFNHPNFNTPLYGNDEWHQSHPPSSPIYERHHRRRSSVIRGLSIASQLVDRENDETDIPIQLPLEPSRSTSSHHKRNDSKLNNILFSFTNLKNTNNTNNNEVIDDSTILSSSEDAVEIDIPNNVDNIQIEDHTEQNSVNLSNLDNNNNNNNEQQ